MTLDEAINKFCDYAQGKGDFDELDLKEVIVDNRDEAITRAKGTIDLEALIRIAGYDLREIIWHSNGRVIAKSGRNAKHPNKLYASHTAHHALSKLIADNHEMEQA